MTFAETEQNMSNDINIDTIDSKSSLDDKRLSANHLTMYNIYIDSYQWHENREKL